MIFKARADFAFEQMDRSDLITASNCAASAVKYNLQPGNFNSKVHSDVGSNLQDTESMHQIFSSVQPGKLVDNTPPTEMRTGLLNSRTIDDDEDNYD